MPSLAREEGGESTASIAWRFLADENLPRDLVVRLSVAGCAATHVIDVGLRGQPDDIVYAHAQANGDTLITTDLGFGNPLRYPPPYTGIVVARLPDTFSIGRRLQVIMDGLALLAGQPLADALVMIEAGRVRVRR